MTFFIKKKIKDVNTGKKKLFTKRSRRREIKEDGACKLLVIGTKIKQKRKT